MNKLERIAESTASLMRELGRRGRQAAQVLSVAPAEVKSEALCVAAKALRASNAEILEANAMDLAAAQAAGRPAAFLDRLALDAKRIEGIAASLEKIAALPDPVGSI